MVDLVIVHIMRMAQHSLTVWRTLGRGRYPFNGNVGSIDVCDHLLVTGKGSKTLHMRLPDENVRRRYDPPGQCIAVAT
ncbi:hypothetical protein RA275_29275, partial [Pseudomonas syringae pv. tagetis]